MLKHAYTIVCGMVALAAPLLGAQWETDMDTALARATKEKKAVLVDFTGSDWCGWCVKLRKEVLDTEAFTEYAQDKFVLLEVDVPKNAARVGGEAKLAENRKLCEKFNVQAYPTLMAMSAEGIALKRVSGYNKLTELETEFASALKLAKALRSARRMKGLKKAKLLMAVYARLDPRDGAPLLPQIAECDPENETRIKSVLRSAKMQRRVDAKLNEARTAEELEATRELQAKAIKALPKSLRKRAKAAANDRLAQATERLKRGSKPQPVAPVVQQEPEPKPAPMPKLSPEDEAQMTAVMERFNAVGKNVDEQIRVLEEAMTTASPTLQLYLKPTLINVLLYKMEQMGSAAKTVDDVEKMRPLMQRVVDLLPPEARAAAEKDMENKFRDPEKTLKELKAR